MSLKRQRTLDTDISSLTFSQAMPSVSSNRSMSSRSSSSRGYYKRSRNGRYYRPRLSLRTQLTRTDNMIHRIVQSGTQQLLVNGVTGFSGTSQSLNYVFNGTSVLFSLGGGGFGTACTFANSASLTFCFDKWRLDKVVMQIIFTSNSSATNSGTQLPTLYGVIDTTDTDALGSNSTALAYGNCKFMQLGNSSGTNNGVQIYTLPNPTVEEDVLTTTGVMLTAAGRRSPWLNTQNSTVQHNGVKFFVECPGSTNQTIGYMQIAFRCFYSFKNVQ